MMQAKPLEANDSAEERVRRAGNSRRAASHGVGETGVTRKRFEEKPTVSKSRNTF